ncbi:hypothetical protein EDB80DRAFT_864298 [Ilyonectria destructans]|nr:hypothetical protein EDB80DRAFT_864298 [Ilyonectria destructans]
MTEIDAEALVSMLTLDEKLSLLAGGSQWRTAAVERLGIPNLKMSDGPSGARGEIFGEGVPAAFLPSGVSLGATWDETIMFEIGKLLAEEWTLFFTYGSGESVAYVDVEVSQEYEIRVEYRSHDRQLDPNLQPLLSPIEDKFQGVRIGYEEFDDSNLPGEAAQLASECDAAVVVVGRDKEWETEGEDSPIFELPGEQVRLIKEVAAVCKRTIVLVQAVLYTWYQGQEFGNAAVAEPNWA